MKRLTSVAVTKLFGALDHQIALDRERGITIIHGANGTGKTTILRAISELSRGFSSSLARLQFHDIRLNFEDGTSLVAKKDGPNIQLELYRERRRIEHFNTKHLKSRNRPFIQSELFDIDPHLPAATETFYFDESVASDVWLEHVEPSGRLFRRRVLRGDADAPEWLKTFWNEFQCTFIEEQRLLRLEEDRRGKPLFKRVVEDYAARLKARIKDALGTYAQYSQQLDRTFPGRVVEALEAAPPDFSEVTRRLQQNEKRRNELHQAGLVDKTSIPWYDDEKLKRSEVVRMLSVFVSDTEKKLGQFDDIYQRITLFEDLVNSHFMRKQVKISKDAGLTLVVTSTNEHLDPAALSSGEQHLLVLFFELIFGRTQSNHLVMIDEPELSLHPAWQLRLIDDLERVRQVSRVDFLLATHSPQIVGDKWDLTRELSPKSQP